MWFVVNFIRAAVSVTGTLLAFSIIVLGWVAWSVEIPDWDGERLFD